MPRCARRLHQCASAGLGCGGGVGRRRRVRRGEPLVLTTPTVAMRLASDDEGANPTRPGRFTAITIRLEEALP